MPEKRPIAPADFAGLMLIASIWGVNNLFAMLSLEALPPLFTAAWRFGLTALVMAPFLRWPKADWRALVWICFLIGPLHFGVQYIGLAMADDLSPMVIGMQLWMPASVVFAALILKERISALRAGGIAISFAGVALLAFDRSIFTQLPALALVAFAAAAYGLGAVYMRRHVSLNPLHMQGWIALTSLPLLIAATSVFERGQIEAARAAAPQVWVYVAFGSIASSLIANALMFKLVQKYEVSRTTPYILLAPIIAITLGIFVMSDPVSWQLVVGGAMSMIGVTIVALAERRGR
jgi:O-acetylserine/cysteine efflux transporter